MDDLPTEFAAEFETWLDDYIGKWSDEVETELLREGDAESTDNVKEPTP